MNASKSIKPLLLIWIVFGAAMLLQTSWFRRAKSITFDETYFLSCGLQTVHDGKLDTRICSEGVAPLPILLDYLLPLSLVGGENRPSPWEGQLQDARLIVGPRLANSILVGLPLVLLVSWWLFRRQGAIAAALGAGLIAFSPGIVGHASLAATDACFALFGTLALAAIGWYFVQPSSRRFVVTAIAIAAGMAAKYSGVFLLPVVAVMFVLRAVASPAREQLPSWWQKFRYLVSRGAALAVLIGFFWWGLHLFSFTGPLKNIPLEDTPDWSPWVKILGRGPVADEIMRVAHENLRRPAPFDGVLFQYLHNQSGHGAFLMGRRSETGWWYYFPSAFAMKSTPVELLLAVGLLVLGGSSFRSPFRAWRSLDVELQVLCIGILVFSALVVTSSINIGHRYILILYPLLVVLGVDRLCTHLAKRPKTVRWCAAAILVGQIISCLSVAPHYLAYFNVFVGGPKQGWHYLLDSNIDWGQDLPALQKELHRLGSRRTAMQYFGTALPEAYGVDADPMAELTLPVEEYDMLAVSVSPLQGLYTKANDPYKAFRRIPPTARAGYSMLLFDLATPQAQAAMQQAAARYRAIRLDPDSTTMGGLPAYRIETPAAVYVLEKAGGGLASVIDREGHDWIGFDHTPGSRAGGEYRGFPNAVHQQAGNYFHAKNQATDLCSTRVEYAGPGRVTISAESDNGLWACRYDFFPTHCTFTMTRMPPDKRYWVLYEGTPGGKYDDTDWWMTSGSHERRPLTVPHEGDIPAPEWIAFGDKYLGRVLYLFHHEDDDHPDRFCQMDEKMTVFGFGREGVKKYLDHVPQQFTIGFVESTDPARVDEAIQVMNGRHRVNPAPPAAGGVVPTR